jgi:DNA repair protein RecN (Recombination protein N)
VICITHFPQVAESAHYHFQISKVEKEGRTLTEVVELNQRTKQRELNRMAGLQLAKV